MAQVMRLGYRTRMPQRAFLAVPAYSGVASAFAYALFASHRELLAAGIAVELEIFAESCHVDDARNRLVRDFLDSDCTDLVFLDSDLCWDAGDLVRLLRHDRDVVAGIYPKKQEPEEYPVKHLAGEIWSDRDGLIEVEGVPTGFLRIRRHVLDELAARAPSFLDKTSKTPIPVIFERTMENGSRIGGDYTFCRKWRAAGGKIYIDPLMRFAHFGEKAWTGSYGGFLKRRAGLALEGLKAIRLGKETSDTLAALQAGWNNEPFASSTELLYTAIQCARDARGPILECGSGLSTLVMAAANPNVTIHALENEPAWAFRLSEALAAEEIKNVRLHLRPLCEYVGGGAWYDTNALFSDEPDGPPQFSLVLCDGPRREIGMRGLLFEIMRPCIENAVVLVDDIDDPDQSGPLAVWAAKHGRTVHHLGGLKRFGVSAPVEQGEPTR